MIRCSTLFFALVLAAAPACLSRDNSEGGAASHVEKESGWTSLFDGKSLAGWRNFKKPDAPTQGWQVENGVLHLQPGGKGGDLITIAKFTDFDLRWEWKIVPNANNGIKYLVTESRSAPGPEYQMIDDAVHEPAKRSTASLYDILPKTREKPTLIGQWNHSRVLVQGNHVEHWLNGAKVLEYTLGSSELKRAIAQSKFKAIDNFGDKIAGHILLTDHHDEVWYRNIKLRDLAKP